MDKKNKFNHFIGVDVAKKKLDIFNSQTGEFTQVINTKKNIRNFIGKLQLQEDLLVVIDLTEGYEQICVDIFHEIGFSIYRAEGRRIKAFMKCYGQFAKTDKIDAKSLALYGEKMQDQIHLYSPKNGAIEGYLESLSDLAAIRQQEKNRIQAPTVPLKVKKILQEHIDFLDKKIKSLESEVSEIVKNDTKLKQKCDILTSVKGIDLLGTVDLK